MPPLFIEGEPVAIVEPLIAPPGQTMELTRLPEVARKTADQTVNNDETMVPVTELLLPMRNGEVWSFVLMALYNSSVGADLDVGWDLPGTSVMRWGSYQLGGSIIDEASVVRVSGSGADRFEQFQGIVFPDADGDLQLTYGQGTAEVSDTKVLARSFLIGTRLA